MGFDALELRPDRGVLLVHFDRTRARWLPCGFHHLIQLGRLGQPVAVEINRAGVMVAALGIEPVAVNEVAVGIEAAEERIGERHFPSVVPNLHPVLDDFRPLDLNLLSRSGLIDDALRVGFAPARRADAFAVNAFMHRDDIARLGKVGGMLNGAERSRAGAGVGIIAIDGDMEIGGLDCGNKCEGGQECDEYGFHICSLCGPLGSVDARRKPLQRLWPKWKAAAVIIRPIHRCRTSIVRNSVCTGARGQSRASGRLCRQPGRIVA